MREVVECVSAVVIFNVLLFAKLTSILRDLPAIVFTLTKNTYSQFFFFFFNLLSMSNFPYVELFLLYVNVIIFFLLSVFGKISHNLW